MSGKSQNDIILSKFQYYRIIHIISYFHPLWRKINYLMWFWFKYCRDLGLLWVEKLIPFLENCKLGPFVSSSPGGISSSFEFVSISKSSGPLCLSWRIMSGPKKYCLNVKILCLYIIKPLKSKIDIMYYLPGNCWCQKFNYYLT